jgi:folate-binding protein YgfZ
VAAEILWCRIAQSGLLRFDGSDTQTFLQGQLTSDVAALDATNCQYSGYCTPKGRLLAVLLLWRREAAYCMLLPRELCEPIRKRLSMYILRAKVKASDISSQQVLFGLSGAGAADFVSRVAGAVPAALHQAVHASGFSVIKLPRERYLIAADLSAADALEAQLAAAAPAHAETLWSALDIDAGIPAVYAATQEQFVPQTVNFDRIGALSFDKGCYPGQEIVARTHYLGKLKQRMVHAQLQADTAPAPGDKLFCAPFGDQASGMIVSTVCRGANQHDVLAVVQMSGLEEGTVHWQSSAGPALHIVPLHYS